MLIGALLLQEAADAGGGSSAARPMGVKRTATKQMRRKEAGGVYSAASIMSGAGDALSAADVRTKALLLLGRLGGASRFVVGTMSDAVAEATKWESSWSLIQLPLMLNDKIFQVTLDDILPNLAESATSSPDRQTKVAAAEALHAVMTWIIGTKRLGRRPIDQHGFSPLLKRLFPVCLRIGADVDGVCCEVFKTLTLQCARYAAELRRHQAEDDAEAAKSKDEADAAVMVESCLDSLSSDNTGLRSLAAECINEYVKFSLKAGSKGGKVDRVLRHILASARHSSALFRLGACAAITAVYVGCAACGPFRRS